MKNKFNCVDCKKELKLEDQGKTWDILLGVSSCFDCNSKLYGEIDKNIKYTKGKMGDFING